MIDSDQIFDSTAYVNIDQLIEDFNTAIVKRVTESGGSADSVDLPAVLTILTMASARIGNAMTEALDTDDDKERFERGLADQLRYYLKNPPPRVN